MKKTILLGVLVVCNLGYSQLFVQPGEEVTVLSGTTVYSNEDVNNDGTITFAESDFIVDSGLNNVDGVINYNDVTLFIGGGDNVRSASTDDFFFKDRDPVTQFNAGEQVKYVVLNKNEGQVDVRGGHLSILEEFTSTDGVLNADGQQGGVMTLLNRSNTEVAQVLQSTGGTPRLEAERFFPANRAWRFINPSTSSWESINANWQEGGVSDYNANDLQNPQPGFGTHITGQGNDTALGFDQNTASGQPSMFTLDNANQAWVPVPNTITNQFQAGTPYRILVRGDRTIDLSINDFNTQTETILRDRGLLIVGSYPVSGLSSTSGNFNLIGNPYHSQVDMAQVLAASTGVNPNVVYVWDPNISGNGAYVTVDLNSGSNPSGSQANQYLQPKQSALVVSNGNPSPQINFAESHKKPDASAPTAVFSVENYINIKLHSVEDYVPQGLALDGIRINFGPDYSNTSVDDFLHPINLDETLSRNFDSNRFSIEYRSMPQVGEELQLGLSNFRRTDYLFEIEIPNEFDEDVVLYDQYTEEKIVVDSSLFVYEFSVDANIPESMEQERFKILFENETLGTVDFDSSDVVLYPNPSKGSFTISGEGISGESKLSIFNQLGQKVYNQNFANANNSIRVQNLNLSTGVYIVKVESNNTAKTIKLNIN